MQSKRFDEVIALCDVCVADPTEPPDEFETNERRGCYFVNREEFITVAHVYKLLSMYAYEPEKDLVWLTHHRAEAWFLRGQALIELGSFQEAAASLNEACTLMPWNPECLAELGYCHQGMKDHMLAVQVFMRARDACRNSRFTQCVAELKEIQDKGSSWPSLGVVPVVVGCGSGGRYVDHHSVVQSWFRGVYEVKACEDNDECHECGSGC